MPIARAFAFSKARLKIVNVCFLKKKKKKKRMHFISLFCDYQENYFVCRKFLFERCLAFCLHFVRGAIYSKKGDHDAYSQGCAFSKARLKSKKKKTHANAFFKR
jgi:hypothetical protein